MTPEERSGTAPPFDPFSDRSARMLRNRLAETLGSFLERREVYRDPPPDLLHRYPGPPYSDYIRDRAARYRAATREALSVAASPLAQAAVLWRHGLYFEAHDILEPHWRAASGPAREGLQGLIQAAGVYLHREAGHDATAVRLARKAVARLRRFGAAVGDQPDLDIQALVDRLTRLIDASPAEAACQDPSSLGGVAP